MTTPEHRKACEAHDAAIAREAKAKIELEAARNSDTDAQEALKGAIARLEAAEIELAEASKEKLVTKQILGSGKY